ncbi:glutaredoxin 3 [Pseudooceanicola sp. CBS1P-1]|uniref:Glutaredoxin n=1 Tax=Pseudooceanicola albus TaxID=2692189 RepID=A0A6L7GAD3_9RHOB|nr:MULTISPECIES: glutaredoxin 3 [Pseudooceanicola]MBT9386859.1 glutaredoxin 3 [Pseudooceanicola endophyticus]MXN21005.1 glutaredoxin 3 [Pseudooceanicola albus]
MPRIDIYTTPFCGFCSRAKALLKKKGIPFNEIGVTRADKRRSMMARAGGAHTVPQIFIGEIHVGGCSELLALEHAGQLDQLLSLD